MPSSSGSSHAEHKEQTTQRHGYGDYGGNPLAHVNTGESARLPAFGGAFQPGLYRPPKTQIANPAPLGLAGFALTTFLLSLVNLGTRGLSSPSIVIGPAFAYGGLIQLLAGMWDIAVGNVFGGCALSSYGGFWIGLAIILTPGGFRVESTYMSSTSINDFYLAFSFYLYAWMIFTFIIWLCTLKSTVAFSSLLFTVWITFLLLATSYYVAPTQGGEPSVPLTRAGGAFGIVASFIAWWNMLAGIADPSNSLFLVPVFHFPWSEKGREQRKEKAEKRPATNGDQV
ncbi:Acetate permease [Hortaea werneckii]|uniref:Uncharacterized protein n=1 Tax=Hortaea werneckii TaxID=91943 RepID=A0A3M7BDL7_HORWE|nr:Acetate permease [Hortaea werneckii]KAI6960905.1 Acetate permease [Hortaea werneckii]KAI7302133.1 Acetate permease [Hortaea werneckii]KAI7366873.1 Acetate permease [Hortaea werneckii]KAI7656472.1 Acetate permease [Hortaea werneckii]